MRPHLSPGTFAFGFSDHMSQLRNSGQARPTASDLLDTTV